MLATAVGVVAASKLVGEHTRVRWLGWRRSCAPRSLWVTKETTTRDVMQKLGDVERRACSLREEEKAGLWKVACRNLTTLYARGPGGIDSHHVTAVGLFQGTTLSREMGIFFRAVLSPERQVLNIGQLFDCRSAVTSSGPYRRRVGQTSWENTVRGPSRTPLAKRFTRQCETSHLSVCSVIGPPRLHLVLRSTVRTASLNGAVGCRESAYLQGRRDARPQRHECSHARAQHNKQT